MPLNFGDGVEGRRVTSPVDSAVHHENSHQQLHNEATGLLGHPLIINEVTQGNH